MTFRYGEIEARVEDVGEGSSPHSETGEDVYEYRVTVRGPSGGRYTTRAWGSINDFHRGRHDHAGMASMVVEELASAASDPDEFVDMVIGEERGRRALERGKEAEKVVAAARRVGHDALFRASDFIRGQEERGGPGPEEWRP